MLFFRSGILAVGPESAGSNPGPVCYRKGGPLTVTDANVFLGRIRPETFPHIFGPNEDMPLDIDATRLAFDKLTNEVNAFLEATHGPSYTPMAPHELAMGFIRVANEAMCRPIRNLTQVWLYFLY